MKQRPASSKYNKLLNTINNPKQLHQTRRKEKKQG